MGRHYSGSGRRKYIEFSDAVVLLYVLMTYYIFPTDKPQIDQIIYIIDPARKERLSIFKGGNRFDFYDSTRKGYYAKYWRCLTDAEQKSFDDSLPVVRAKRKYTRRLTTPKSK